MKMGVVLDVANQTPFKSYNIISSLVGQTSRLVGVVSESKGRLVTYVHIPLSLANIRTPGLT